MEEVSYIQKSDKKVNNQYTFVSHDAVSAVLHPLLVKHGIAVIPRVSSWGQDGNRTSADVVIDFVNADKPEDKVEVPCFGFGIDPQDKGPGKAVSYATKYAMLKVFVLETGDDPERDMIDHVGDEIELAVKYALEAVEKGDWVTICEMDGEHEIWMKVWSELTNPKKKVIKEMIAKRTDYRDLLITSTLGEDPTGVKQLWDELDKREKESVWACLNDETKEFIKSAVVPTIMTDKETV